MKQTHRTLIVLAGLSLASAGCGESVERPTFDAGTGGGGGSAGIGGAGAIGGFGGLGGSAGSGGSAGIAGTGGSGGIVGTGGSGGAVGTCGSGGFAGGGGDCETNALCGTCPSLPCASDEDCSLPGYICVPSGCTAAGGGALGQCQEPRTGSCATVADCPNASDYACDQVGFGGKRCLRVTPGCDAVNESYDCAPGFACEGGACVDRRVPCTDSFDCPKSHICKTDPTAQFCVRIYRTCHEDTDCAGFASRCADVDGDGRDECTGLLEGSACINASCSNDAPVCENGNAGSGTTAICGDFGLCLNDTECGSGFECLALGADGRKECVPIGARQCDSSAECPLNQVCASGRSGGTPVCQTGCLPAN